MKLRAIAHSRTGDKGNTANISLIAYDMADYVRLEEHVTVERVREHFSGIVTGEIVRYTLPGIGALNFVLKGALGGGVTRSLALDAHGKGLGSALLDLEMPERPGSRERGTATRAAFPPAAAMAGALCAELDASSAYGSAKIEDLEPRPDPTRAGA